MSVIKIHSNVPKRTVTFHSPDGVKTVSKINFGTSRTINTINYPNVTVNNTVTNAPINGGIIF